MILALDIATTTGWAVRQNNGRIVSGSYILRKNKTKDVRYIALELHLMLHALAKTYGAPDIIAYEEVKRHMGWKAAKRYWSLLSTIEQWTISDDRFVPMMPLAIHAIKIHATGKGNADKDAMKAAARVRGWNFTDDNEADALFVLDLAIKNIREAKE